MDGVFELVQGQQAQMTVTVVGEEVTTGYLVVRYGKQLFWADPKDITERGRQWKSRNESKLYRAWAWLQSLMR